MKNKNLIIYSIILSLICIALNISKAIYISEVNGLNIVVSLIFLIGWITLLLMGYKGKCRGFLKFSMWFWILSAINGLIVIIAYKSVSLFNILMIPETLLNILFTTPIYGLRFFMTDIFTAISFSWVSLILSVLYLVPCIIFIFKNGEVNNVSSENEDDDIDDLGEFEEEL